VTDRPQTLAEADRTVARVMARLPSWGEQVALVSDGSKTTFAQLDAESSRLANSLLDLGVASGERLAFALPTGVEIVHWYLACAKANFVGVPLPTRLTENELIHQINDSGAVALAFSPDRASAIERIHGRLSGLRHSIGEGPAADVTLEELTANVGTDAPGIVAAPEDPFCVMYTGGTTGASKAAVQTHQSWACSIASVAFEWALSREDRHLMVLPMSHVSWFSVAAHLYAGAKTTLFRKWDPLEAMRIVEAERLTVLNMVPTMLGDLVRVAQHSRHDVSSVRQLTVAGSPVALETFERAVAIFGPVIGAIYGMTETSGPITFAHPREMTGENLSSAGKPGQYIEMAILDDEGKPLAHGETGEIGLRGPQVTAGYLNQEQETAAAFRNGWFHTGDVGHVGQNESLYIVDRKKDMIKTGGYSVYPKEIEDVLYSHPDVLEAAVIGVPDERWIEAVSAVVVLRAGASIAAAPEQLAGHVREHVAGYKVPKAIHVTDRIPRTGVNKFDKPALRRIYGSPNRS